MIDFQSSFCQLDYQWLFYQLMYLLKNVIKIKMQKVLKKIEKKKSGCIKFLLSIVQLEILGGYFGLFQISSVLRLFFRFQRYFGKCLGFGPLRSFFQVSWSSNVRKNKGTTVYDKSTITCDVSTTKCEDNTIKCKKK